jgi:hypothetical protein
MIAGVIGKYEIQVSLTWGSGGSWFVAYLAGLGIAALELQRLILGVLEEMFKGKQKRSNRVGCS